jgi:hypothetical protein
MSAQLSHRQIHTPKNPDKRPAVMCLIEIDHGHPSLSYLPLGLASPATRPENQRPSQLQANTPPGGWISRKMYKCPFLLLK